MFWGVGLDAIGVLGKAVDDSDLVVGVSFNLGMMDGPSGGAYCNQNEYSVLDVQLLSPIGRSRVLGMIHATMKIDSKHGKE